MTIINYIIHMEIKESKEWNFTHTWNIYPGCSGGCIAIENTNRVIGIHRGEHKEKDFNFGIFI